MKNERKDKLYAMDSKLVDPLNSGSLISYKICGYDSSYNSNLESTITLSDCNTMSTWYFKDEHGIEKIDTIIKMLTEFRTEYLKASEEYKKDFPQDEKE